MYSNFKSADNIRMDIGIFVNFKTKSATAKFEAGVTGKRASGAKSACRDERTRDCLWEKTAYDERHVLTLNARMIWCDLVLTYYGQSVMESSTLRKTTEL